MFNPSHFSLLQVLLDFQRISFCSTFASACVKMLALRSTSQRDLTVGRQKKQTKNELGFSREMHHWRKTHSYSTRVRGKKINIKTSVYVTGASYCRSAELRGVSGCANIIVFSLNRPLTTALVNIRVG